MPHRSPAPAVDDLNLLRAFVAVFETASFSLAAERLRTQRSSVSRWIATLEAALDVRLFNRTTRSVTPTHAAAELHARLGPAVSELEASLAEVRESADEPSGVLRLTSAGDIAAHFLSDVIARYVRSYPRMRVVTRVTVDLLDLAREEIDVGVRVMTHGGWPDPTLVATAIGTVRLGLYGAPRYLDERGVPLTLGDVVGHDEVRFPGADLMPSTRGRRKEPRVLCDDLYLARDVLKAGAGLGLLPTYLAEPELAAGTLVRVVPDWVPFEGKVYLVYPGGRHVPKKVSAFRSMCIETLRGRAG